MLLALEVHLGEMLKDNTRLTHVDWSWNDLGLQGGKDLFAGLLTNHTLIDCQLSGNRISEETLHDIAFVLRRNSQGAPLGAISHSERVKAEASARVMSPLRNSPSRSLTRSVWLRRRLHGP